MFIFGDDVSVLLSSFVLTMLLPVTTPTVLDIVANLSWSDVVTTLSFRLKEIFVSGFCVLKAWYNAGIARCLSWVVAMAMLL